MMVGSKRWTSEPWKEMLAGGVAEAAAEAEALRLDAARSGAQEELIKLKCVNEKLTQEAERVDRVRLDEERRSAARRARWPPPRRRP